MDDSAKLKKHTFGDARLSEEGSSPPKDNIEPENYFASSLTQTLTASINSYTHTKSFSKRPSSASTDSEASSVASRRWTRNQKLTAVSMALMNFSTQVSFSVIAPFYPVEAAKKGATSTEIGLIFGIFQLVIFVTSPIYGQGINKIGAKPMFISGSLLCGFANIVFGFLDGIEHPPLYILLCFTCRILEANGASMMSTASFAIMAKQFSRNVGSALGMLKTFSGIGMALGPSIGGALYAFGGFKVPFIVVGSIVVVTAIVSQIVLPKTEEVTVISDSFVKLLKSPGCTIIYLVVIGSSMALTSTDPIFSPFMTQKFGLTPGQIGLIFMTSPAVYAIVAPICGWISDKGGHGTLVVLGCFLNGASFLLQGPSPLLQPYIPLTILGMVLALALLGVSVAFVLIPIFPLVIKLARSQGYEENLQTYGIISGFFNSGSALGAFVGPTASGYFCQKYNFEWSTSINAFIVIGLGFIILTYIVTMRCTGKWPLRDHSTYTNTENVAGGSDNNEDITPADENTPLLHNA